MPAIAPPVERLSAPEEDGPGYIKLSDGAFQLPSSELLEYQPPKGGETDAATLRALAERLEQALSNYGVQGKVTAIQMGPVIITFEFAPAPGTRTGKIVQLENDLAMALEAQSVRIVAPIPGKAVVGIEIPNKKRETVYLKEILEDDGFRKSGHEAADLPGQGHQGRAGQREPVQDAAPAGRRHHRLGQVGRGQRHDHQHPLLGHSRGGALHHGGPEDARAVDLRGHPAPACCRW